MHTELWSSRHSIHIAYTSEGHLYTPSQMMHQPYTADVYEKGYLYTGDVHGATALG